MAHVPLRATRRWVWSRRDRRSWTRQVLPFVTLAFVELIASTVAIGAAAAWAANHDVGHLTRTVVVVAANVVAFATLWVLQYVVCDRLLFHSWHPGGPLRTSGAGE